jgi:hypothetical protein
VQAKTLRLSCRCKRWHDRDWFRPANDILTIKLKTERFTERRQGTLGGIGLSRLERGIMVILAHPCGLGCIAIIYAQPGNTVGSKWQRLPENPNDA